MSSDVEETGRQRLRRLVMDRERLDDLLNGITRTPFRSRFALRPSTSGSHRPVRTRTAGRPRGEDIPSSGPSTPPPPAAGSVFRPITGSPEDTSSASWSASTSSPSSVAGSSARAERGRRAYRPRPCSEPAGGETGTRKVPGQAAGAADSAASAWRARRRSRRAACTAGSGTGTAMTRRRV